MFQKLRIKPTKIEIRFRLKNFMLQIQNDQVQDLSKGKNNKSKIDINT